MKSNFKFFRGYSNSGTLDLMDGQPYATASLYDPHHGIITHEQYIRNRDAAVEQGERLHRDLNDDILRLRLFQTTTVTTVNPNWGTKIKMGLQVLSIFFKSSPYGIMFLWASSTIVVILILSKILSIW